jgi:threonine dehydratase
VLLAVTIPEERGSYRRFIQLLGNRTVTEFNYRYAGGSQAHVFVGLRLADARREKLEIMAELERLGYGLIDISADETAKLHIRYMVGGRAAGLTDEMILRCEFPERPGALLRFLDGIGGDWNITLFHYRNHGADYGRVLVGVQVSAVDLERFTERMAMLGYPYEDETANDAYRLFLRG